jgi:predicted CoA-substrate-specific enzyme activase
MNDRCAAGAGRFLKVMASALGCTIETFGATALAGGGDVTLNSLCAVFAESEVVGLLTRGVRRESIARAVHRTLLARTLPMLRRVSTAPPIVFAGGGALNPCLLALLEEALGMPVVVPPDPQSIGARGAALLAAEGRS